MESLKVENLTKSIKGYVSSNEKKVKDGGKNFSSVEHYGRMLLLNFFQKNGFFCKPNSVYNINEIKNHLNLNEKFNNLFDVLLIILEKSTFIKVDGNTVKTNDNVGNNNIIDNLESFRDDLINKFSDMKCHFNLLDICLSNYGSILSGEKSPDSIMFPVYSTHLVEGIFRGNMLSDYFNDLIADISLEYTKKAKENNPKSVVKILEIGAGTGGTSISVMEAIKEESDVNFYFTDISKVFVKGNERKLKEKYPFSIYKKLNIEEDIIEQGFTENDFDIVIATNVVHATKDIAYTLNKIKTLLKVGGILLLNEVTKVQDFTTLTFGLLGGWWHFSDLSMRLPNSPLLSIDTWKAVLKDSGYKTIELISTSDMEERDSFSQSLFLAQK